MSTAGPLPRAKHRNAQHGGFLMSTAGPLPRAKHRNAQHAGFLMSTAMRSMKVFS